MKYSSVALLAAVVFSALFSSCQSNKIRISGRFIGGDSSVAYLEEVTAVSGNIVDSVALSQNGEFVFEIKAKDKEYKLYNIVYDWSTIPLFVVAGDKVKVNSVGNLAKNYTIEGSDESELMRRFYQNYITGIANLDQIALRYADENISEEQRLSLAREYSVEYNRIKREQLEFIITNKASLASVYALYQRLPNDSYLFNGRSDAIYYRTVAEALVENYPTSPYLKNIEAAIENFDAYNSITDNIQERGYIDLEINDMFGEKQKLSSLEGKVILLDFWSARLSSSNRHNAELKEVYEQFKEQGFEVYQVGIDSSKSTWINAVQEQALPWITVSDLKGSKSPSLSLYNVTALPSNFLISKDGNIIMRDTYGESLLDAIKVELSK